MRDKKPEEICACHVRRAGCKEKCMKKYYHIVQQITYLGFFLLAVFAVRSFDESIPSQIYVTKGRTVSYEFGVPVSVELKENDASEVFENLSHAPESGRASARGAKESYTVTCRLFGIFPVKDVEVMLVDVDTVYASGMPIGIYAKTDGVLVIGAGAVTDASGRELRPAENLVRSGDYIVSVNGETVTEKDELIEKINAFGGDREILGIRRQNEYIEVSITPVKSTQGSYMLGIWVRDDLAGVGTLTYFKQDGQFGALGHAVSDGDTGTRMEMSEGWIYQTSIVGIRKGEKGSPGELSGIIDYSKESCLGSITENTPLGIRGVLSGKSGSPMAADSYEVAYKQDIRMGTAYIISSIGGAPELYEISIESLDFSGNEENKGILFRVTDRRLLALTGGIVQGMSGSPIIQEGKMIGAVTHVFVSDASKGYGIFIEKMLR